MTTTVTTITKSRQVFTRTWSDLDPKVRNALIVWAATALSDATTWAAGRITLDQALGFLAPVTLAVLVAYVTTSKHKDVIVKAIDTAAEFEQALVPAAAAAFPAAAEVADSVQAITDQLAADLGAPQTAPAAPAPAPAVAAAPVPAPVAQ